METLLYSPEEVAELRRNVEMFGFGCLTGAIAADVLAAMQAEARERFPESLRAEQSIDLAYRANISSLGPCASEFLNSHRAIELLAQVFDGTFALADGVSCLTFYKEGDHLGAHRDQPADECQVTVLAYLVASGPAPKEGPTGLELRVYGEEMPPSGEPILTIPTRVGAIVLGRGSMVWHERPKLQPGEFVSALTGCYKAVS